jgi:hypothetical protein
MWSPRCRYRLGLPGTFSRMDGNPTVASCAIGSYKP